MMCTENATQKFSRSLHSSQAVEEPWLLLTRPQWAACMRSLLVTPSTRGQPLGHKSHQNHWESPEEEGEAHTQQELSEF